MGKVYAKELAALGDTYEWARGVPIDPLEEFVDEASTRPLLAIGSGGSATAAHLAALLHRFHAGAFARYATPLDILLSEPNLSDTSALLLSASGKNRDVLATLERCVRHLPNRALASQKRRWTSGTRLISAWRATACPPRPSTVATTSWAWVALWA